jgi:propionate CoA-transferase
MDERIFQSDPMNLKDDMLSLSLEDRLTYDPEQNLFFVNFEGYSIKDMKDVQEVKDKVEAIVAPLGHKVYTIINYDNFTINPDVLNEYTKMVRYLVENYYTGVTRYTTSTFLRTKLGDALQQCNVTPHIYETQKEALQALEKHCGLDK